MVINGGARSGSASYAAWLGWHLTRTDSNERVYVRSLDGVTADDLAAALLELSAMGSGARSKRGLYHANIDWRHDEVLTEPQKGRAVDRLADELGLSDQPRVVVEHTKGGRSHLHVVWLRIDPETGHAISDSHNFRRHEIVARDLEREFGLERVQGVHVEREGIKRPQRTPEAYEFAQAERSGITPAEAKAELSAMWRSADTGQAFAAAIDAAGWTLAQGDKRDVLVALDPAGEAHAINKKITGLAAKDVRARLADLDASALPSVDQARQAMRKRTREAAQPVPEVGPEMGGARVVDPSPEAIQRASQEVEAEPEPAYVPNFVLVADTPTPEPDLVAQDLEGGPTPATSTKHEPEANAGDQLEQLHQVDELEAVEPKPQPIPWGQMLRNLAEMEARQEASPGPETGDAKVAAPSPEATQRASQEVEAGPAEAKRDRLAEIVAAARARLATLADRLDVAFGRIRDQVLKPETAPTLPPRIEPRIDWPEAPRPRSIADDLLEAGRRRRQEQEQEKKPEPEPEADRSRSIWDDFGRPRTQRPGEPSP